MKNEPEANAVNSGDSSGPPLPAAAPRAVQGSETVINPERRPNSIQAGGGLSRGSSILRALFPVDLESGDSIALTVPEGLELGHFLIEERIGSGGMGAVFRARDKRLQRTVALKVLAPGYSRDSNAVQRFQNEARATARLDHDNIAGVYYVGEDQGVQFIAYEFVEGQNVRDLIHDRRKLDPVEAVNYTLQIAAALAHMSAAGVTHRDVKPSNIIVNSKGRAKLVDLGLARKEKDDSLGELTLAGTTLGTFDYISPEQAKDPRKVDVRSDIYSLGCTLYHMLTGEPPYPEGTVLQKLLNHQGNEPPDPALKNRKVTDNLSAVVRRMMASDPQRRYATPEQLIRDLMMVAGTMGMRGVSTEGLIWTASGNSTIRFWEKHVSWMSTAAALIIIVFGLQGFRNMGRNGSAQEGPRVESTTPDRPQKTELTPPASGAAVSVMDSQLRTERGADDATAAESSPPVPQPSGVESGDVLIGDAEPARLFERISPLIPPGRLPTTLPPDFLGNVGPLTESNDGNPDAVRDSANPASAVPRPGSEGGSRALAGAETAGDSATDGGQSGGNPPAGSNSASASNNSNSSTEPRPAGPTGTDESPEAVGMPGMAAPLIALMSSDGNLEREFSTLEAACAAASDGSVIELRYNGPLPTERPEKPLQITDKKITIRAKRGMRPLITFAPDAALTESDSRMITVNGGALELLNVDIRLKVSERLPAANVWTLLSLQSAKSVRCEGVTIRLENPGGRPAAVVELARGAGEMGEPVELKTNGMPLEPRLELTLLESVVVATADLIQSGHGVPARLEIAESALALEGAVLRQDAGLEMVLEGQHVELRLDHTTVQASASLLEMHSDQMPMNLMPTKVVASNNIFSFVDPDTPLITMSGDGDASEFFHVLASWYGNRNFYDGLGTFLLIQTDQATVDLVRHDFEDWNQHWIELAESADNGASNVPVIWRIDWRREPLARATLLNFLLEEQLGRSNSPISGATDGRDAGVDITRLPALPVFSGSASAILDGRTQTTFKGVN